MSIIKSHIQSSSRAGISKKNFFVLMLLSFLSILMESSGVAIFLPIFQFIRLKGEVDDLVIESSIWPYIIDFFSLFGMEVALSTLLLAAFSFFILRQVFIFFRITYQASLTQKLTYKLRNKLFKAYLLADARFYDKFRMGKFVNTITVEVSNAVLGVMTPIELLVYFIMATGYIVILLLVSTEMTIASMLVISLSVLLIKAWIRMSATVGRDIVDANTKMSNFLVERVKSPILVRLSGTQSAEVNEFVKLTGNQRKHSYHSSVLQAKTEITIEPVIIGMSLIFLYLSYTAFNMQIEVIGLYLVVALRLMPIVKSIIAQWQRIQHYKGSVEIVSQNLELIKSHKEINHGSLKPANISTEIEFNNVFYKYGSLDNTLSNITFNTHKNKLIAIVGPSGSGKSTLISLIPRIRSQTSGSISIGGISIEKYNISSLRKFISYVPQEPQIFNVTVKEHISYGNNDITSKEIEFAAQASGASEFIRKLPKGYDTKLGENASKLSGGQKQRLDLARALANKSKILILDEPTSSLDSHSKSDFMFTLRKLTDNVDITIFVISHDLKMVMDFDEIIILNNGRIEAIGKHNQLINTSVWYKNALAKMN